MYAYKNEATVNTLDCFAIARNDAKRYAQGKPVILRGEHPEESHEKRSFGFHPQDDRVLKKKAAFTLAEVLITLGIIGIVAAMTLPVIIQDTKNKELEAQFKKGYSSLQQAILRANYEGEDLNSLYSGGYITSHQEGKHLHEIIGKQFVNSKIEDSSPAHLIQAIKGFSGKDVNTSTALVTCAWDDGYILAAGQMSIYFETVLDIYITIDTNGGTGPIPADPVPSPPAGSSAGAVHTGWDPCLRRLAAPVRRSRLPRRSALQRRPEPGRAHNWGTARAVHRAGSAAA